MPKLHMRCSIEIDVPEKQFKEIIDRQLQEWGQITETEYAELPRTVQVMIETKQFELCDWDEGGYVPQEWLEYDAVDSGLYEIKSTVDDRGLMHDRIVRKENAE